MLKARTKFSWAQQLKLYIDNHPAMILFTIIVLIISGLLTIGEGLVKGVNFYQSNIGWRKVEEKKLNKLSAGINVEVFKNILGTPVFIKQCGDKTELMFYHKSYWVQAITNITGTVDLFAIAVCDKSFTPLILDNPVGKAIRLGVTKFSQVESRGEANELNYFIGNTAPTYFIEGYGGSNPNRYQYAYWGINDICPYNLDEIRDELYEVATSSDKSKITTNNEAIKSFRNKSAINMFAVASMDFTRQDIQNEWFIIGGNRVETRVYNGL